MVKKNTRSTLAPWLLIGLGSLLILGVVIWKTVDVLEKTLATPTPEYSSSNTYLPFPDVDRISLEDAKTAYDAGTAVFIDVRDAEYFAPGHITGALNIPYSQVESQLDTLDPGQHIILYCT